MALTKKQADSVLNLFSNLFIKNDNNEERKLLFLEFEDVFGKSIYNWQSMCRERIEKSTPDVNVIEYFNALANRKTQNNENEYLIRKLSTSDLAAVRELINTAFGMHLTAYNNERFNVFIESGYSFVACNNDEIIGVILGYAIPDLNTDAVYIDTFTVAETARGYRIGSQLLSHIAKCASDNHIYMLKLHTDRAIDAYQIYKHSGFEESKLVQMKKYIM